MWRPSPPRAETISWVLHRELERRRPTAHLAAQLHDLARARTFSQVALVEPDRRGAAASSRTLASTMRRLRRRVGRSRTDSTRPRTVASRRARGRRSPARLGAVVAVGPRRRLEQVAGDPRSRARERVGDRLVRPSTGTASPSGSGAVRGRGRSRAGRAARPSCGRLRMPAGCATSARAAARRQQRLDQGDHEPVQDDRAERRPRRRRSAGARRSRPRARPGRTARTPPARPRSRRPRWRRRGTGSSSPAGSPPTARSM